MLLQNKRTPSRLAGRLSGPQLLTRVQILTARRARLPPPVQPQPLIRIAAYHTLQLRMQNLRIERGVAGQRQGWIETQNVLPLLLRPQRKPWNDSRPRMRRYLGEPHHRAGRNAKEIDKDAVIQSRVLVDQDPHRFIVLQRL